MFALYASERNWLSLSRPDLPIAAPVVGTVAWRAFAALAPAAECSIVAVPPGDVGALYQQLRLLHKAHPFVPLVLVTDRPTPSDVSALGEVVRPPLLLRRLWPAIQRATTRALLSEASARAAGATERTPVLRAAAAFACRADPPVHSVGALADAIGCHRRTLWRHWQSSDPMASTCGVDDLLDWTLLLRACTHYRAKTGWGVVAERIGVHRQTLARVALALAHVPLRDVTPDLAPRLRTTFRRVVLDPFAPRHAVDDSVAQDT